MSSQHGSPKWIQCIGIVKHFKKKALDPWSPDATPVLLVHLGREEIHTS